MAIQFAFDELEGEKSNSLFYPGYTKSYQSSPFFCGSTIQVYINPQALLLASSHRYLPYIPKTLDGAYHGSGVLKHKSDRAMSAVWDFGGYQNTWTTTTMV
jgi:hypothetical protein